MLLGTGVHRMRWGWGLEAVGARLALAAARAAPVLLQHVTSCPRATAARALCDDLSLVVGCFPFPSPRSGTFVTELNVHEEPSQRQLTFSLIQSAFMKEFVGSWHVQPGAEGLTEVRRRAGRRGEGFWGRARGLRSLWFSTCARASAVHAGRSTSNAHRCVHRRRRRRRCGIGCRCGPAWRRRRRLVTSLRRSLRSRWDIYNVNGSALGSVAFDAGRERAVLGEVSIACLPQVPRTGAASPFPAPCLTRRWRGFWRTWLWSWSGEPAAAWAAVARGPAECRAPRESACPLSL